MLVNTEQLIELLAEASGLTSDNIERQLKELTTDIEQAISEGEAYEIESFGIFSGIGNRIMFIPSQELETEINYKYVGMEPIELDEPAPMDVEEDDDPFGGLIDKKEKSSSSAFTGLIEGLDELDEPEQPGADQWGVDAHKEDDSAGRLFASLMGQDYEESADETNEDDIFSSVEEEFDPYGDDIFGGDDDDTKDELADELSELMSREPKINAYDESSSFLDDLIDDAEPDEEAAEPVEEQEELEDTVEDIISEEELLALNTVPDEAPFDFDEEPQDNELSLDEEEIEEPEDELEEKLDEIELPDFDEGLEDDDFDDPFSNLDAPEVNDELIIDSVDDEDIIPVIKNLSSESVSKPEDKKEEKKEKAPEKKKKEKKKKEKTDNSEKKPAPVWLWIVLLLVVTGSAVGALGYLNIIHIPYISPQVAVNRPTVKPTPVQPAPTQPPVQQLPDETTPTSSNTDGAETTTPDEADLPQAQEQAIDTEPTEAITTALPTGNNPEKYGLKGELSAEGNDGYTIITHSLSNQANANREAQRLVGEGYRAMIIPIPSDRYGTLYRVCIGQFGSLFDAAVAAEGIMDILPENYLIKKIN